MAPHYPCANSYPVANSMASLPLPLALQAVCSRLVPGTISIHLWVCAIVQLYETSLVFCYQGCSCQTLLSRDHGASSQVCGSCMRPVLTYDSHACPTPTPSHSSHHLVEQWGSAKAVLMSCELAARELGGRSEVETTSLCPFCSPWWLEKH